MKSFNLDMSFNRLVDDAANLCRWNPVLGMKWFNQALARIETPLQEKAYNRAVKRACATLDSIESSEYYSKEYHDQFWGEDTSSLRPELSHLLISDDQIIADKLAS